MRGVALAVLLLLASLPTAGAQARRVVSLDWSATAMLLTLGIKPVGVADIGSYRDWVAEPKIPDDVPDVGLTTEPNLEVLAGLQPDLILLNSLGEAVRPTLERVTRTRQVNLFGPGGHPIQEAAATLRAIGADTGRTAEAERAIAAYHAAIAGLRARLAERPPGPLLVMQFLDERHIRIYSRGSLYGDVLAELGLKDGWTGDTNLWGFSLVGTEALAGLPDLDIVVVDPLPPGMSIEPNPSTLWGSLPGVRAGRVRRLPAVWPFGELTAGERFAKLLADSLDGRTATLSRSLTQAAGR